MGGQNYGTFWIKKGCAPFCALFGQIMCDFELKTIGNSDQNRRNQKLKNMKLKNQRNSKKSKIGNWK